MNTPNTKNTTLLNGQIDFTDITSILLSKKYDILYLNDESIVKVDFKNTNIGLNMSIDEFNAIKKDLAYLDESDWILYCEYILHNNTSNNEENADESADESVLYSEVEPLDQFLNIIDKIENEIDELNNKDSKENKSENVEDSENQFKNNRKVISELNGEFNLLPSVFLT